MLLALSGQIIVIIDSWPWAFKGITQKFEVTAIITYGCGI